MSKIDKYSVTKFYNGEAWSFTVDDSVGIESITFGKRFIMGGLSKNHSAANNYSSNKKNNLGSKLDGKNDNKAVIKITGHNHNAAKLKAHIDYITRNGTIEMEDQEGDIHKGEIDDSYKNWIMDHGERASNSKVKKPRIASSIIISAPPGSSPEKLHDSVREFASKAYCGHRYFLVLHTDETETNTGKITEHPHVHLVIERRSPDNEKALSTNIKDIQNWRKEFSEIAKSRGLDLSYQRSEISKQPAGANNRYIYAMLKKGEIPEELKVKYTIAKNRLKENRVYQSEGEKKIIDKSMSDYVGRQKEISDIRTLLSESNNPIKNKKYKSEIKYLEYINSSQRMPVSTSQLLMKYAIHEVKAKTDKRYKFHTAIPTVKHYMYGQKLAERHGKKLPPTANIDIKVLSEFIKVNADIPSQKLINFLNKTAQDRNLIIPKNVFTSQKKTRIWIKKNSKIPTVKALNYALKLSDEFNVSLPRKFNDQSIKSFISEYAKKPTEKMIDYANIISERSGKSYDEKIIKDKASLSKWINENEAIKKRANPLLKKLSSYADRGQNQQEYDKKVSPVKDDAIIKIIEQGIDFPKDKLNDNEYKLNFLRAHAEFKDSDQWIKLNDKMKSINKEKSKNIDIGRD